jgi:hypothetical protein
MESLLDPSLITLITGESYLRKRVRRSGRSEAC